MFARLLQQEGSEEGESRISSAKNSSKTCSASFDEGTIEVGRRGRGRPLGSKNKPKPSPHLAIRDPDQCSIMRPLVLEIPGGTDVVNAVFGFAKRRNVGLCVLTASGTVTNVSLRQPSFTPDGRGAVINFHGRFDLLSISATFIPPLSSTNSFTISLAGPQGQIIGGSVAGALAAVGTVFLVAASFDAHSYYRLPIEEEMLDAVVSPTVVSGAGDESHGHHGSYSSNVKSDQYRGMPASSCQLPSDINWASTSPF
ncbi:hypothetical protein Scep_002060 [Stephania cephalantha]|uniref:AT-hook motif nuclear-localized protein n=1 Tax=Stephania cephalantha TaxID=152367 RepID=A0AAP0Q5M5_9MAGN